MSSQPQSALERVRAVLAPIWDTATPCFHYAQAVLDALGIPSDADLVPFHKVGRMDGESVDGEYTWNVCDGPDDWTTPENGEDGQYTWSDEPVTYYIDSFLRIGHVERVWPPRPAEVEPANDAEVDERAREALGMRRVR